MINTRKNLTYLVTAAALTLASCSYVDAGRTASQAGPAAQQRFNVYFDVAKSDLTPEAQQVIAQAVAHANQNAGAKIIVVAPETDKARRTDTVQAALVAGGVSPDRIDARWIGPQASAPGIRDPRNRMVEISFVQSDSRVGDTAKLQVSPQTGD